MDSTVTPELMLPPLPVPVIAAPISAAKSGAAMRLGLKLWIVALLALACGFVLNRRAELGDTIDILRRADARWIAVAVAFQLAVLALIAQNYRLLMRRLGHRLGWRLLARAHLRRHVVATVVPFGGPPSMILFARDLRAHGVSTGDAVYMTVLYGVVGNAGFMLFLGPVLLWIASAGQLTGALWLGSLVFAAIVAASLAPILFLGRHDVPESLSRRVPAKALACIAGAQAHRLRLRLRDLAGPVAVNVAVNGAGVCMLYASLRAIGQHPAFSAVMTTRVVGILFTHVSPVFGGAGLVELTMVGALVHVGVAGGPALAGTLMFRLAQCWLPLALGLLLLVDLRRARPSRMPGWGRLRARVNRAKAPLVDARLDCAPLIGGTPRASSAGGVPEA